MPPSPCPLAARRPHANYLLGLGAGQGREGARNGDPGLSRPLLCVLRWASPHLATVPRAACTWTAGPESAVPPRGVTSSAKASTLFHPGHESRARSCLLSCRTQSLPILSCPGITLCFIWRGGCLLPSQDFEVRDASALFLPEVICIKGLTEARPFTALLLFFSHP